MKSFIDTFPAGTLSGAPKVRAMQLISEIEPHNRGAYGGCIGFIGLNGELNQAIAIRYARVGNSNAIGIVDSCDGCCAGQIHIVACSGQRVTLRVLSKVVFQFHLCPQAIRCEIRVNVTTAESLAVGIYPPAKTSPDPAATDDPQATGSLIRPICFPLT